MSTGEEMVELSENVEEFIQSIFPKTFEIDYSDTDENQKRNHKRFLRRKYGKEVVETYCKLQKSWKKATKPKKERRLYGELIDYVYRTGLSDDLDPEIVIRVRTSLEMLLMDLARKKREYDLVDLGSGDGMIDIGLVSYLPNLRKVHVVDKRESAIYRLNENIETKLEGINKDRARKKIQTFCGDFEREGFIEEIKSSVENPVIFLCANTPADFENLINITNEAGDENSMLYLITQTGYDDRIFDLDKSVFEARRKFAITGTDFYNLTSEILGIKFNLSAYVGFVPNKMLALNVGRKDGKEH